LYKKSNEFCEEWVTWKAKKINALIFGIRAYIIEQVKAQIEPIIM
jgi:hypothetical protein